MIARVLRWSLVLLATPLAAQQTKRPMTFLDVQEMRTATPPAVSLDGRWGLYSVSTPDWRADRRQSDLYLVSMSAGLTSPRPLPFTQGEKEGAPGPGARAGAEAGGGRAGGGRGGGGPAAAGGAGNQLYYMRPDGGEAQRITEGPGVGQFQFTRDGRWLVYSAGRGEQQQLYAVPGNALLGGNPVPLTRQPQI